MTNTDDNDDDRLADVFEQYRDDDNANPGTVAQTGRGKTIQLLGELARRVAVTDNTEFIDPKGGRGR